MIGDSRSWKASSSFSLINQESDIDKVYVYAKDPYKAKCQFLIKKREGLGKKAF